MPKLKALQVKNLKAAGRHSDDTAGLHLFIQGTGDKLRKSWVQRITVDGKRKDIGLGGYPGVTLAQARNMALDNRERIRTGKDVQTGRQPAKATKAKAASPTFDELANLFIDRHAESWSGHKMRMATGIMRNHLGAIRPMPVDAISRRDVTGILEPLLTKTPAMAQKVRALIAGVLGDAEAKDLVTVNHAGPVIDRLMHGAGAVKTHQRSLPYDRVADALAIVDGAGRTPVISLATRFLALTAARYSEIRLATWTEIDWENRLWIVPAAHMKGRREHRQPLSGAALDVLRQAWVFRDASNYVFPSMAKAGQPLGKDTVTHTLTELEIPCSAHGFRSSFRTWAQEETDAGMEVAEGCLSHVYGDSVVRSYARGDMLAKRRDLLDQWADFLESSPLVTRAA